MWLRISLVILLVAGCRTSTPDTGSKTLDASGSACADVQAVSGDDKTGQEIFDLTSRCVFNRDVHTVRIRILSETFQKVLDDGCADRDTGYGHVIELELDGHKIANAGIKVRGNTSRCNQKRQFKIKLDEDKMFSVFQGRETEVEHPENKDRRFFGVEVLNLRASTNDPSNIRERLGGKVYTQVEAAHQTAARGGLSYRSSFTKFYVSFNRRQDEGPEANFRRLHQGHWYDYKGFYTLAENIDKVFVESRFQESDEKVKGTLIQTDLGAAYFDRERYSRRGFDAKYVKGKKAKKDEHFATADEMLGELIDLLDNASSEEQLAAKIDIDNVVNYMAATQLVGHWDSLLANRNNDYLYYNDKTEKWQIITWDLDNSFGVIRDQYSQMMQNDIFNPAARNGNKFFRKLFSEQNPGFRAKLKDRLRKVMDNYYNRDHMRQTIESLEYQFRDHAEPWEGYNMQHYVDLKNFVNARMDRIRPQL